MTGSIQNVYQNCRKNTTSRDYVKNFKCQKFLWKCAFWRRVHEFFLCRRLLEFLKGVTSLNLIAVRSNNMDYVTQGKIFHPKKVQSLCKLLCTHSDRRLWNQHRMDSIPQLVIEKNSLEKQKAKAPIFSQVKVIAKKSKQRTLKRNNRRSIWHIVELLQDGANLATYWEIQFWKQWKQFSWLHVRFEEKSKIGVFSYSR